MYRVDRKTEAIYVLVSMSSKRKPEPICVAFGTLHVLQRRFVLNTSVNAKFTTFLPQMVSPDEIHQLGLCVDKWSLPKIMQIGSDIVKMCTAKHDALGFGATL